MKRISLLIIIALFLFALHSFAQTPQTADSTTSFSIADSSAFTGKYKYEGLPFDYMTISVQDSSLYYSGGEYNGSLIAATGKQDVFNASSGTAVFTFMRDSSNKVTELKIDYQGQTYMGTREQ